MAAAPTKHFMPGDFYEPAHKRFMSLENLRTSEEEGAEFMVWDMETGKDVTRDLLP